MLLAPSTYAQDRVFAFVHSMKKDTIWVEHNSQWKFRYFDISGVPMIGSGHVLGIVNGFVYLGPKDGIASGSESAFIQGIGMCTSGIPLVRLKGGKKEYTWKKVLPWLLATGIAIGGQQLYRHQTNPGSNIGVDLLWSIGIGTASWSVSTLFKSKKMTYSIKENEYILYVP